MTTPGVAELLGLTLAAEIGDITRFPTARKLVGYSGLTPVISLPAAVGAGPREPVLRCAEAALARRSSFF
jgi:transposase